MQILIRQVIRQRPTYSRSKSCRFIAGRRYRVRASQFHSSAVLGRTQDDPANTPDPSSKAELEESPQEEASENGVSNPEVADTEEASLERASRVREALTSYGSALRRSNRNRRPKEIPPVEIPDWFIKHNVQPWGELAAKDESLGIIQEAVVSSHKPPTQEETSAFSTSESIAELVPERKPAASTPRYQLHQSIWNEILANIRSSLSLPTSTYSDNFAAQKVHILLQSPKDGGIYFLDSVVEKAALATGADLIRLDAQDIAEIGGSYLGEGHESTPYSIRSLAYEAQSLARKQESEEFDEAAEEDEEVESEDDEGSPAMRGYGSPFGVPRISKISAVPIKAFFGNMEDLIKHGKLAATAIPFAGPRSTGPPLQVSRHSSQSSEQWEDMKLSSMVGAMLEAVETKSLPAQPKQDEGVIQERPPADNSSSESPSSRNAGTGRPLIVQVRDFKEIQATRNGGSVMNALFGYIGRRRKAGQAVVLIGTVSSPGFVPSISRPGFKDLQSEHENGPGRTIVVTPQRSTSQDHVLSEDHKRRIRDINLRHLQDMLRLRIPASVNAPAVLLAPDLRLDSSVEYSSGLEESVWSFDRVHRVAVTALGLIETDQELTPITISTALQLLDSSDETKFQWAVEEAQTQKMLESGSTSTKLSPAIGAVAGSEARMKRIRKTCNAHEKKLLAGVINPGKSPSLS